MTKEIKEQLQYWPLVVVEEDKLCSVCGKIAVVQTVMPHCKIYTCFNCVPEHGDKSVVVYREHADQALVQVGNIVVKYRKYIAGLQDTITDKLAKMAVHYPDTFVDIHELMLELDTMKKELE